MNTKINILSLAVLAALNTACSPEDKNSIEVTSSRATSDSSNSASTAEYINIKGGFLQPTSLGVKLYTELRGHSNLVISQNTSELEVHVWGLTPLASYQSVVNEGTCADVKVGVYWFGKSTLEPVIDAGRIGSGAGYASLPTAIGETSLSLVIKELGSENVIACADLHSSQGYKGRLQASAKSYVSGEAYVSANDKGSSIAEINGSADQGLYPYSAYVNKTTCWEEPAQYYMQNLKGKETASNGLWPHFTTDGYGAALGWASNPFKVRLEEIKSISIWDDTYMTSCAELDTKILMFRSGSFIPTDAGVSLYGSIDGRAILETSVEGITTASIRMGGLKADTTYMNHVHNGLCADGGGGHYLHDINGDDDSVNGMFPVFTSDEDGLVDYKLSVDKIVRPDARSIVIHEPGTGEKIACADLE